MLIPTDVMKVFQWQLLYATNEEQKQTAIDHAFDRLNFRYGLKWSGEHFTALMGELNAVREDSRPALDGTPVA